MNYEVQLIYFKKGDEEWGNEHVITATSELTKNHNLIVYPNPSNNYLNISLDEGVSNSSIQIYNMNGQLLLSRALNSNTIRIDVSDFINSLYFVHQLDGAGKIIASTKFMKI